MPPANPFGGRLILVANRLPVTLRNDDGRATLVPSIGGLATGLSSTYDAQQSLWVGWPGDLSPFAPEERRRVIDELDARSLRSVELTQDEIRNYYELFANGVIWPLFHYLLDRVPLEAQGWDTYVAVNQRFASAVLDVLQPGDRVWIHDYQLMLVPGMIRERAPDARIGFFLHIPFPAPEVFRTLPWRQRLLEGLLGADLVGFHTGAYVRHFATALRYLLGLDADVTRAWFEGREVRLDAFPMGIDAEQFDRDARNPAIIREVERLRADAGGRTLLLGVDRLDYTKGLPRRMLALERLFERHPELRDAIRLIQVAVPTRDGMEHYQSYRRELEETIGRINGAHGSVSALPIHYLHRSVPQEQLVALYRAADVMLVTPIRDGMNLVAKEFVASRVDDDGVLVLSEFAGAASELAEALHVNPYDLDAMASVMKQAIEMPLAEQRTRMRALRQRVRFNDVSRWAARFAEQLDQPPAPRQLTPRVEIDALLNRLSTVSRLTLLLDYDGTLVPIVGGPALATPDPDLLTQLRELTAVPGIDVQLVSGRAVETLEAWLGGLPIGLWAEHGLWYRPNQDAPWELTVDAPREWMERVRPLIRQATQGTPGSLVEEKTASFAWHYRMADPDLGERHARELRAQAATALADEPVAVLEGSKVVEIRLRGVSKAIVIPRLAPGALLVAFGDDRTDEDMFAALPPDGVAIHVGPLSSGAHFRLKDWRAVRQLLHSLAQARVVVPTS